MHYDYDYDYDNDKKQDTKSVLQCELARGAMRPQLHCSSTTPNVLVVWYSKVDGYK